MFRVPENEDVNIDRSLRKTFYRVLRSFNGPEPGGLESTDKKVKERERG